MNINKGLVAWRNSEGEIDMVFVPDRSNVYHTRQYFLEVKKLLQTVDDEK